LCRICEAVRHVQLQLLLYPVKEMQELVGSLYSHLVKFAVRAIKWYQEPRILHALSAITRPYSLRFRDIVEDIHDTIRQIDRLALSMNQAEQRQILLKLEATQTSNQDLERTVRLELEATRKELEASRMMIVELKAAIDSESKPKIESQQQLGTYVPNVGANQLQFNGLINTNRQLSEIQLSQVMTFLSTSVLPSPDAAHNTLLAKRLLRLRETQSQVDSLCHSPTVHAWAKASTSSQIMIHSSFTDRFAVWEFLLHAINTCIASPDKIPGVWALDSKGLSPDKVARGDVIKYLASQILQHNRSLMDERSASLSAQRFQSARTERDWFNVLGTVLEGLKLIYVFVDLNLIDKLSGNEQLSWLREFPKLFDNLRERGVKTIVKVVFVRTTNRKGGEDELNKDAMGRTALVRVQGKGRSKYQLHTRSARSWGFKKKKMTRALQPILGGTSF